MIMSNETHEARPQTATRLREMAEASKRSAETSRYLEKNCRADMFRTWAKSHRVDAENYEANVVALLAGAAALEAVEVAKRALEESFCMCEQIGRNEHIDVCAKKKALAALARLEAL